MVLTVFAVVSGIAVTVAPPLAGTAAAQAPVPPVYYALGDIDGQHGWAGQGGGNINDNIDQAVVANSSAPASFGEQSWRISNAFTSGSFGDQAFSPSVADEAGEQVAENAGLSGGARQDRFIAEWEFSSASPNAEQPGMRITASPDRGDGARMSWVRMEDSAGGLRVVFNDYQRAVDPECDDVGGFVQTVIATGLDRASAHRVRLEMDFVDGIANDVVRVLVDDALVHTGTSWEDYFRDCEGNQTRTVDSVLFRSAGANAPGSAGAGLLIDNLVTRSADQTTSATTSEFSTGFEAVLSTTTTEVTGLGPDWFAADTRAGGQRVFDDTYGGTVGTSAVVLSTTAANADKVQLLTDLYDDTLLSDIQGLSYSTYRDSASAGFVAGLPALNLRIDRDNNDVVDAYLVYEPYQDLGNGAVQSDTWQTWNAIRGGDAKWWSGQLPGCGQGTPCTWDTILSTWPQARVLEDPDALVSPNAPTPTLDGSLGINLGSFNPDLTAAVDGLTVTVGGERRIFDFKALFPPGAPTGLVATPDDGVVDLSWTAPADDGGTPVTGYVIRRNGVEVGTTTGATTFQDTTANGAVPSSAAYSYTVSAENAVDEGPQSAAVNATVHLFWKGLEWDLLNATAEINGDGGVDLTRLGSGQSWIHVVGEPPVNANGTPWVEFDYEDDGNSWQGIDMFIDSGVPDPNPRISVGSLFANDVMGYARYGNPVAVEEIVFPAVETPVVNGPRPGGDHAIYVGQAASGRIDYRADGSWYSTDFLQAHGAPFDFNDVLLRWRCNPTVAVIWERVCTGGDTITFNDFAYGDDHDDDGPQITVDSPVDAAIIDRNATVAADYACSDPAGVVTCDGPVADGVDIDTLTLGAHDFTVTATDEIGNESTLTHSYTVVDGTDPSVTITSPEDGETYDQGQSVLADFACADEPGGSGIASCGGTVADGAAVDTSTAGDTDFTVTATDNAGNETVVTHTYTVEIDCPQHPFPDVPPWVDAAVDWSYCGEYLTGIDGLFVPDDDITRAQVARFLYRIAGSPDVSALPAHGLSDVPAWVEEPVRWLMANDYATGYPDDTFRPNLPISRAQVTRMLFRIEGSPSGSPTHGFTDVPAWVATAVNWIADPVNVPPYATGYDDDTFRPNLPITRAQATRMGCRINAAPGSC